jgi:hypothetical protein
MEALICPVQGVSCGSGARHVQFSTKKSFAKKNAPGQLARGVAVRGFRVSFVVKPDRRVEPHRKLTQRPTVMDH